MTRKYKVCVRCATFNHAPYITQTMDGFCIQQTDDDTAQYLERGKYPRFRVIIDDECTAHELANALHKASEYLHKRAGKGGIG